MKEAFEKVQIEVIELGKEDILTTSGIGDQTWEMPISWNPEKTFLNI